ncbi:hypothetical protein BV25DRAFT_1814512, partial [Artomyces pyxidatus]
MLRNSPKVRGYRDIPGLRESVLVSLFADDTVLFLSAADRYTDVKEILQDWCEASGAKFNIEKTEIVPIGTPMHRATVVATRKLHPDDEEPLEDAIHIAADGDSVRSLGAWIGNKVNNETPWGPVLDKIKHSLNRWQRGHPTLNGKKLIVQMVVGGRTQYLAKVQGMPKSIEKTLIRIIRDFMWEGRNSSPIGMDRLYQPIENGGLDLLDLRARNDAIQITWLREYLDLNESRPTWAFITDFLINEIAPPELNNIVTINKFLQKWDVPLSGERSRKLPENVHLMLKTAKKYHTNFAALKMNKHLKKQLPAW